MGIVVLNFFDGWCKPCNINETKFQYLKNNRAKCCAEWLGAVYLLHEHEE